MDITIERVIPMEEAFDRLRQAPLDAAVEEVFIYRNAIMRLCDFFVGELNPTSLYVLREHVELQRQLRQHILGAYGIDTLKLESVLCLKTETGLVGMAPPVVEIYEEMVHIVPLAGDRNPPPALKLRIPILKDGIHRAWLAHEEQMPLRCVSIHGALEGYLPYAYPNAWSSVSLLDSVPPEKKFYRRQQPYSFMRPLKVLRQVPFEHELVQGGGPRSAEK